MIRHFCDKCNKDITGRDVRKIYLSDRTFFICEKCEQELVKMFEANIVEHDQEFKKTLKELRTERGM